MRHRIDARWWLRKGLKIVPCVTWVLGVRNSNKAVLSLAKHRLLMEHQGDRTQNYQLQSTEKLGYNEILPRKSHNLFSLQS